MLSMVLQRLTAKTDRFLADSLSDISEEMIKSSFLERFKIMMFLRYFFVITSSVLFPPFFFFGKCSPK